MTSPQITKEHIKNVDDIFGQFGQQKEPTKPGADVLQGPVLLPVRDRHVLVMPRHGSDDPLDLSLYAFMREWIQNPKSITAAVATRNSHVAHQQVPWLVPGRPFHQGEQPHVQDTGSIPVPDIENDVQNPTIETHLPRWKALGKRRRLEFEQKKAIGFQRLYKRLHAKGVPSVHE